jgi:hypothetical protein
MTMAEILITRSQLRTRFDVANVTAWTEYRIRRASVDERYAFQTAHKTLNVPAEYWLETRRVQSDGGYGAWEYWTAGKSPEAAIDDVIQDTQFRRATSLDERHTFAVQAVDRRDERALAKREIERMLELLEDEVLRAYHAELRRLRLYTKALRGQAPAAIITDLRTRFQRQYAEQKQALEREAEAIDAHA